MVKFNWLYGSAAVLLVSFAILGCERPQPTPEPAPEEETLARTEFTERVENFFEYVPLKAGKPSFFRIHLTDLSDGTPVEKAEVTLTARSSGSTLPAAETTAKIGKVAGIYVAELTIPQPGAYDIEFHIKNEKLDERMPLAGFRTE